MIRQKQIGSLQSGQALAEFVVIAGLVLVPVALGSVYLMKLGNSQHEMQEAARYAAWERTVWSQGGDSHTKSATAVLNEALVRVLGEPDLPIDSVRDQQDVDPGDRRFEAMLSINKGDGVHGALFSENGGAYHTIAFADESAGSGGIAKAWGTVISRGLKLNDKGLQTSTVLWSYDWISILDFGQPAIEARSWNTLLTESWNAGSPQKARASVAGAVATDLLSDRRIGRGLNFLAGLLWFKDFNELELGKVDVEQVPCHRLARGKGVESC